MKTRFKALKVLVLVVALLATAVCPVMASENPYVHNPIYNAVAMRDIIVDPNAVYGFSPNPDSTRLGNYAHYDWTNPELVAGWRQERIAYHNSFSLMYEKWQEMEEAGESVEAIARAVSAIRNEIRLTSYADNPDAIAEVKKSNLTTYGNENGPTPEYLFEKYGSWEKVRMKAFSENPGMDACLGLYDDYYDNYILLGEYEEVNSFEYTVKKGDCLSKIAGIYYGNPKDWKKIYNSNKSIIKNPNLIYVGQVLVIELE